MSSIMLPCKLRIADALRVMLSKHTADERERSVDREFLESSTSDDYILKSYNQAVLETASSGCNKKEL